MGNELNLIKTSVLLFFGTIGGYFTNLLGGWDLVLSTLLIFMAVDFISGLIVAGVYKKSEKTKHGALKSQIGFKGLCKKGMTIAIVLVAHQLDVVIGSNFVREGVIIAFIINETISILENAGSMGVKIPPVIKRAIDVLQEQEEKITK